MNVTIIIMFSLLIIYVVVDTLRESSRRKWYSRGYVDACDKYDETDYRNKPHKAEADEIFDSKYGFDYD